MKVLLTGAAGQLGQELRASRPEGIELITSSRSGSRSLMKRSYDYVAILEFDPDKNK